MSSGHEVFGYVWFNPAGPGQHVPTVERAIRTIKSMVSGIINSLPTQWLMYLAQFVVTRINCMPMRQNLGWHNPKEMVTSIKFKYKRDCYIGSGEHVQASKPQQIIKPIVRTQWTVLSIPHVLVS